MTVGLPMLAGLLVLATVLATRTAAVVARRSLVTHRLATGTPGPGPGTTGVTAWLPAPPSWLEHRLLGAGATVDPAPVWQAWVLGGAGLIGLAVLAGGPGLGAVAMAAVVAVPPAVLSACSGRADRLLDGALPETLETVARSLRSGAALSQAVEEAAAGPGPVGRDLGVVAGEVAAGEPLTAALDRWARRRPLPGVRLAVSALALGAEAGGAHARALDGVAETLRARAAVAGEVRALSAQARISAMVIVLSPLGFATLAAATDGRTAAFFTTPLGLTCLAAGLVLDGLAALWMYRLSQVDS